MDVGTGLALFGSAKIIGKLLGPTADYIGDGIKSWTQMRVDNVKKIMDNALHKLGNKIDEDGGIPPKVLSEVFEKGSYCDDELSAEYFGGVLASSRTSVDRDDRGAALISQVHRLSTYQLRAHYVFYHIFKGLFINHDVSPATDSGREAMAVFIPVEVFEKAMGFNEQEDENGITILQHIMWGLVNEDLIDRNFLMGSGDDLKKLYQDATTGILLRPSAHGVELFLWAYGKGHYIINNFVQDTQKFEIIEGVDIVDGSLKILN
jgi:hypothetical protein